MIERAGGGLGFLIVLPAFSAQPDQTDKEDLTLESILEFRNSIWKFEINPFLRCTCLCSIKNKVGAYNTYLGKENPNCPLGNDIIHSPDCYAGSTTKH